jgi:hypothetical protein
MGLGIIGGVGALWYLGRAADRRAFLKVYDRFRHLGSQERLKEFWDVARAETLDDHVRGLEAIAAMDLAESHAAAATRLAKAARNIDDPSCDPAVAAWILLDAAAHWARLFLPHVRLPADVDSDVVVEIVRILRAGGVPRLRLETSP